MCRSNRCVLSPDAIAYAVCRYAHTNTKRAHPFAINQFRKHFDVFNYTCTPHTRTYSKLSAPFLERRPTHVRMRDVRGRYTVCCRGKRLSVLGAGRGRLVVGCWHQRMDGERGRQTYAGARTLANARTKQHTCTHKPNLHIICSNSAYTRVCGKINYVRYVRVLV